VPDDPGRPWHSRAVWLVVTAVVAVGGVFAIVLGVLGGPEATPTETPAAPVTAPLSTAATPTTVPPLPRPLLPDPRGSGTPDAPACPGRRAPVIRVLQFNIRAGVDPDGDVDLSQVAAEIRTLRPDLVSLNEVDSYTLRTRLDEPAYLAAATGLHVVYGPNLIYDGGRFGNAILSRYPVVTSRNLRLPVAFGQEPRSLLSAVVLVDGRRIEFASTHLSDGGEAAQSRVLQALAVARAVRSTGLPVILAGDLNTVPTDAPVQILRGELLDAQEEAGTGSGDTIPEARPRSRFDYILHDDDLAAVPGSARVLLSRSSDHRRVFAELALLPQHGC
jgi:endonuclease/exonuclease/phosphatase family metal-dependent hydrolase